MEPQPDYCGMTVNERFFSAGLLEDWDAAKNHATALAWSICSEKLTLRIRQT